MNLYPPPPFSLRDAAARRALWRYWGRDVLFGLADVLRHHALRLASTDRCSAIGGALGQRHGRRRPGTPATIQAFFARLRPEATAEKRAAMEVALWDHLGRLLAEFSVLERLWPEGRIEVEGAERIAAVRDAGRPLILSGVHVGNWEALHAGLTGMGLPLAAIHQRMPNRFQMAVADRARRRTPLLPLGPLRGSALAARRLLETRERALLMFIDEYAGQRVHAPLLGRAPRPEGNVHRLARLAGLTGAAVLPVHAVRIGAAARFRLVIGAELPLLREPRDGAAIAADQAVLDAAAEAAVRAHPEQWLMATCFSWER